MSRDKASRGPAKSGGLKSLGREILGQGPLLFSIGVIIAVLTFGTFWIWKAVRPKVLDAPQYRLSPRQIEVVPPPPHWITADDLRLEVMRDASLDQQLSIVDDRLVERVALAFAAHAWVARVEKVEKFHPARVVVNLVYRIPVAAVVVGTEYWPVDRGAVLLPRENFSQAELAKLPRIAGVPTRPNVRAGNVWQDARVQGAALIAEALLESWEQLELTDIRPVEKEKQYLQLTFDLITHGGKHIAWGKQPLEDDPSEPTAAEKIKRLKAFVEQHGSLDSVTKGNGAESEVLHTARRDVASPAGAAQPSE